MEKCVFCEIISRNKKNETQFISESKHSFIILSNPSLTKGHLLIILKKHVEKISELKNFEKKDLFKIIEEKVPGVFEKNFNLFPNLLLE